MRCVRTNSELNNEIRRPGGNVWRTISERGLSDREWMDRKNGSVIFVGLTPTGGNRVWKQLVSEWAFNLASVNFTWSKKSRLTVTGRSDALNILDSRKTTHLLHHCVLPKIVSSFDKLTPRPPVWALAEDDLRQVDPAGKLVERFEATDKDDFFVSARRIHWKLSSRHRNVGKVDYLRQLRARRKADFLAWILWKRKDENNERFIHQRIQHVNCNAKMI